MYNFEMKDDDEDEDEIIEKRRRQRSAILQKYQSQDNSYSNSPVISAVSSPNSELTDLTKEEENNTKDSSEEQPLSPKEDLKVDESDMFAEDYKVFLNRNIKCWCTADIESEV